VETTRFVPAYELSSLWDNYVHLRRIEHFLQMADDLQTYRLPTSPEDMDALGRKMGFEDGASFISDFRVRRMKVKNMYNSLLGTEEDVHAEALGLLEGDLTDAELAGVISFRGVADTEAGIRSLRSLRDNLGAMLSPDIRAVVRQTLPKLLEMGLSSEHPGRALAGLEGFFVSHGLQAAYLRAIRDQEELAKGLIKIFSLSPVLTRILLSSPDCLNWLIEDMPIRKSKRKVMEESTRLTAPGRHLHDQLAKYKGVEWLRLGLFFLIDIMPVGELHRGLTHLAEAVVQAALIHSGAEGRRFAVIAMGRFGGREITYGSDLDLLFVAEHDEDVKYAERIIKTLAQYSDRGVLYPVDMRLRPDGTKGVLIKSVEGYRGYYTGSAQSWEVQALMRARPVAGDPGLGAEFLAMASDIVRQRGPLIEREEVRSMRSRIVGELSKESQGLDIKLGPGGLEEIEFYVQWLQLQAAGKKRGEHGGVIIQNTPAAIRRFMNSGGIGRNEGGRLLETHAYFGRLMSLLRLNREEVLVPGSDTAVLAAKFMDSHDADALAAEVRRLREEISLEVS
jgi:glutamate-ammonia-ligase adenylyltransferase